MEQSQISKANDTSPNRVLQATAIASTVALGCYAIYNFSKKSDFQARIDRNGKVTAHTTPEDSQLIRTRVSKTYKYLFASIATTGATSYALYKLGFARKVLDHPQPWLLSSCLTSLVTLLLTRMANYKTQSALKHVFWTLFNASIASSLCPLAYLGSSIIGQAIIYTASLMGGISVIAMSAPSNSMLAWGSYLSVGLGLLNGFALIQWLYPQADMSNLTVPFSLGLFGLYTAYDTQKVLYNAQDLSEINVYDPINEQMDLYLDSVNLFVDIVRLLIKLQGDEEDDDEKKKNKNSKN